MLALLLLLQAPDSGPVYSGRDHQLAIAVPRLEATVSIDGVLDEPVWRQAARLSGFSQYRPVDGRPAEDSTVVLVWYAPDAIVFGIRGFEAHGAVTRATLADRDNIGADDQVQLLLDTFNDHRRALLFSVNPLGVQQDGVRSEGLAGAAGGSNAGFRFDGVVDLNPDFVYQSRGRLVPGGFEIEVRIPFKSLRYQSTATQNWGFQVVRVTQHSGYEDTWTPVVRANASFLIQSGSLEGLHDLRRGLVMDLTPEVTERVNGFPASAGYDYGHADEAIGGTLRWGVTQNLSLTATANPDFSQVEADVGQVTLNQRFALFFPEKRPFFLDGLEQFDTPNVLIYMRRIADPVAGVKLTGKVGHTGVAYLAAVDAQSQSLHGDNPISNLLRLRRDLGQNSTVGVTYTDRIDGGDYNRVAGADARIIWRKIWFSEFVAVGSWTDDALGGARAGHLWQATFYDRTGRSYGNHGDLTGISPDFVAAAGFVNRVDVVQARIFNRFTIYGKPGALLESANTFIGLNPVWRYDDFFKGKSTLEGTASQDVILTFRGGWGATTHWENDHFHFDAPAYAGYYTDSVGGSAFAVPHALYNLWTIAAGASTPNRTFTAAVNTAYGATPLFAEASEGRAVQLTATAAWKPTTSLRTEASWVHARLTRAGGGGGRGWFSTTNIPRLKIEYQLTRDIFFRYVGQYLAQQRDTLRDPRTGTPLALDAGAVARTGPASAFTAIDFRNDFLFSYRPTPGTVFFFGYGASLGEAEPFGFHQLTRSGDGFFLKASYLFRM